MFVQTYIQVNVFDSLQIRLYFAYRLYFAVYSTRLSDHWSAAFPRKFIDQSFKLSFGLMAPRRFGDGLFN